MADKMIIALLLDESGSMAVNQEAALAGINEYIDTMKEDYKNNPELGDIYFSFVTFSSSYTGGDSVRFKYNLRHIKEVEKIPSKMYKPAGGTPLLQAIGRTMESLDGVEEKNEGETNPLVAFLDKKDIEEAKVIMVIQTDGEETEWNSAYSKERITKMIKEREDKGNWTFVFLGAGIDAISEGMKMGLGAGSTYTMVNGAGISAGMSYTATYKGAGLETSKLRASSLKSSMCFTSDLSTTVNEELNKSIEKNKEVIS